jgi:hypothetical protein
LAIGYRSSGVEGRPDPSKFDGHVEVGSADRLLPAPPNIAALTVFHYVLLGESEQVNVLREMFENLLVASMDRKTATNAHRIRHDDLPTDARRGLDPEVDRPPSVRCVQPVRPEPEGYVLTQSSPGFRTLLGIDLGIKQPRLQQCISNLERIGILARPARHPGR